MLSRPLIVFDLRTQRNNMAREKEIGTIYMDGGTISIDVIRRNGGSRRNLVSGDYLLESAIIPAFDRGFRLSLYAWYETSFLPSIFSLKRQ
jgi:hypothetical protein